MQNMKTTDILWHLNPDSSSVVGEYAPYDQWTQSLSLKPFESSAESSTRGRSMALSCKFCDRIPAGCHAPPE